MFAICLGALIAAYSVADGIGIQNRKASSAISAGCSCRNFPCRWPSPCGGITAAAPSARADLNGQADGVAERDLQTNSEGRLSAPDLFPDFNFRSPVQYRVRATEPGASWLVGSDHVSSQDWVQYDSNAFRRVSLMRTASVGLRTILPIS